MHVPFCRNDVELLKFNSLSLFVCSLRAQCTLLGSALTMTLACWRPSLPRGEASTTTLTPMRRCVWGGRGGEGGGGDEKTQCNVAVTRDTTKCLMVSLS